ncbi:hypothetical protein CYMTET_54968, partial [Cymbomonas tetramitiformis]
YVEMQEGDFVDVGDAHRVVGQHRGLAAYTYGQRARIGGQRERCACRRRVVRTVSAGGGSSAVRPGRLSAQACGGRVVRAVRAGAGHSARCVLVGGSAAQCVLGGSSAQCVRARHPAQCGGARHCGAQCVPGARQAGRRSAHPRSAAGRVIRAVRTGGVAAQREPGGVITAVRAAAGHQRSASQGGRAQSVQLLSEWNYGAMRNQGQRLVLRSCCEGSTASQVPHGNRALI